MKRIAIILGFLLLTNFVEAQDFKKLANKICDSIATLNVDNPDSLVIRQLEVYQKFVLDTLPKIIVNNRKDYKNQFNIFDYKMVRELNRECPENLIKHSTILPLTAIIDFDSVFSLPQKDSLESIIYKIRTKNKIQVLVLEIDELFPYDNLEDLSFDMLNNWHIGANSSKGGVLIIFSKALRKIRISTNSIAKDYLTDSDCQSIIDNMIVPNFKKGMYFQGIYNSLEEIKRKT